MRGAKRSATEALLRLPTPVAQPLLARMRPSSGKYAVFVVLKGSDPLQRHALNPTLPRAAHKRKLIDTCHARQRANSVFRMTAATICWWQRSSRRLLRSTTETCGDGDAFPGVRLSGIHCLESSKCWASRCACPIATLQSMDLNHWSERLRLASYLEQAPRSCVFRWSGDRLLTIQILDVLRPGDIPHALLHWQCQSARTSHQTRPRRKVATSRGGGQATRPRRPASPLPQGRQGYARSHFTITMWWLLSPLPGNSIPNPLKHRRDAALV